MKQTASKIKEDIQSKIDTGYAQESLRAFKKYKDTQTESYYREKYDCLEYYRAKIEAEISIAKSICTNSVKINDGSDRSSIIVEFKSDLDTRQRLNNMNGVTIDYCEPESTINPDYMYYKVSINAEQVHNI